ncbi:chain length determinant protein EpsF [Pseudoduganella sp. DS3]|uniref:Chain length determinant protein EpsF n=1 Tax=Pseudoduganella guangdongensis TaxID=2692179 RepID=A0A6N9HNK3_9BURK|nr:chain length determinant protein EpsF [Pseudoduganella guangdongensis]MYN04966.1 chain length determinant protein EpsF [Pseudoduganella guangdongensis]
MNFAQFLLILQARKKIVLLTLLVTVAATLLVSLLLPKTYEASTSLVMNYKGVDPLTGMALPGQLMPGYMATQVDIIGSKNVALRVVDQLKLAESRAVIEQFNESTGGKGAVRDWLAELLQKKLDVVPARESSVLNVSFKASDPQFAAAVANAFAEEYMKITVQLKVDPMKKATTYFNSQLKLLRDNLEAAQAKLSKYQQEHGIVSVDNRLDVESMRLNDLSAQLVQAQAQLMEATSRQSVARGSGSSSPDVTASPVVQNLRVNLAQQESKLAELGQRLGRNHPQYQSASAEVARLRAGLNEQTALVTSSVSNNANVFAQREAALRSALAEQKAKVLQLNRQRDEMNVLNKDMEIAQRAFDQAAQRVSQTRIEGGSDQSDVSVLNPAVAPIEPSGPRVLLNTVLSLLLGSMLGIGIAMLSEMFDRRVRSESDLAEVARIPVLATIDWNPPRQRRFGLPRLQAPQQLRLS